MSLKKIIFLSLFVFSCSNSPDIPEGCSNLEFYLTYEIPSENIKEENVTYKDGLKYSGRCSVYYETGELASIQQYINGKDHGKWIFYHINGQIEAEGQFEMGRRVGKWKYYFENGQTSQISKYKDGVKNGLWKVYSEEGKLVTRQRWSMGQTKD